MSEMGTDYHLPTDASAGTWKFDRDLTHILHDELHWLDVPQRVTFKLCVTVYKCLHGLAPQYLSEL